MNDLMPLWQIEDELTALVDSIDVCPEHLKEELEQRIAQYVGAEVEKVDRIAAVLSSLDNVAANARAEIERLRERQQSAEKAARRLESYVLRVLRKTRRAAAQRPQHHVHRAPQRVAGDHRSRAIPSRMEAHDRHGRHPQGSIETGDQERAGHPRRHHPVRRIPGQAVSPCRGAEECGGRVRRVRLAGAWSTSAGTSRPESPVPTESRRSSGRKQCGV